MTIKRPVIKGGSIWSGQDVERLYTRQEVESKAKAHAAQLWKLLVEKLGARLAKDTLYEIMGDKKPGPRSTDEQRALTYFIRLKLQSSDSNLSDEQIAKRILKSEPHYLQSNPSTIDDLRDMAKRAFGIDLHDDDLRDELRHQFAIDVVSRKFMEETLAKNPKARGRPVGKGLAALEKKVGRIRREMIEEGLLPKAYAPKPYHRG